MRVSLGGLVLLALTASPVLAQTNTNNANLASQIQAALAANPSLASQAQQLLANNPALASQVQQATQNTTNTPTTNTSTNQQQQQQQQQQQAAAASTQVLVPTVNGQPMNFVDQFYLQVQVSAYLDYCMSEYDVKFPSPQHFIQAASDWFDVFARQKFGSAYQSPGVAYWTYAIYSAKAAEQVAAQRAAATTASTANTNSSSNNAALTNAVNSLANSNTSSTTTATRTTGSTTTPTRSRGKRSKTPSNTMVARVCIGGNGIAM